MRSPLDIQDGIYTEHATPGAARWVAAGVRHAASRPTRLPAPYLKRRWHGTFQKRGVFTKRTQLKNAHVFRYETVMKKQSWVRYAKKALKIGEKAPEYRSGRVVLRMNEPNLPRTAARQCGLPDRYEPAEYLHGRPRPQSRGRRTRWPTTDLRRDAGAINAGGLPSSPIGLSCVGLARRYSFQTDTLPSGGRG